jgi:cytochrome c
MRTLIAFVAGLIVAPLLLAGAGIIGWLPSNATAEPPGWESSVGMRAIDASLERRSDRLSNPIAQNDLAAMSGGKTIYASNCAGCHGDAKGPSKWGSKNFYPRAPQFFQEGSDVSPAEAFAAIHDGIRYSGMGAWDGMMKQNDMWKVANFVANIRGPGGKKMDMDRD